jgi:hypothetical protein
MRKRTVIRVIKNGRVKIYGIYYHPTNTWVKYDGCLENTRQKFYIYAGDTEFIFMHDGPIIDGAYPWCFWYPETEYSSDAYYF